MLFQLHQSIYMLKIPPKSTIPPKYTKSAAGAELLDFG